MQKAMIINTNLFYLWEEATLHGLPKFQSCVINIHGFKETIHGFKGLIWRKLSNENLYSKINYPL